MTTLYGPWEGGSTNGRIVCIYTRTYTADHTQAIYNGTLYFETDQTTTDSVNAWGVSGDDGSHTGSNVSYSFGSGGGMKAFYTFSFQKYGDGSISGLVSGVEAVGTTVNATFSLDSGALAPYFTDATYGAISITSTGCTITGFAASGNGGTLNNIQVQYNTVASATGASTYTKGTFGTAAAILSGLTPNTTYYARVRFSNNTYGYGAWGGWATFKTAAGLPSAPSTTWYISDITQNSAATGGVYADTGGSTITDWDTEYNTAANSTGSTVITTPVPDVAELEGLNSGTIYYARIRAKNANGYGPWSDWKSFTTLSSALVNVDGVWKQATVYVKVGSTWYPAVRYVAISDGVGGVNWKQ